MTGRATLLPCLFSAVGILSLWCGRALALDEPVIWRDPDTGCAYLLAPQGIAPRYRRDGTPDCPDTRTGSRIVDETARGLAQGLDALQREVERLRDRYNGADRGKAPF